MVKMEKVVTRQLITKWHERARIDYSDLYVRQYIAYNAWFRKVTGCTEDHDAIREVSRRFIIWDDYLCGRALLSLGPIAEQIANLTERCPVKTNSTAWDGRVKDKNDWRSIINFWYQTRCGLFHGLTVPGNVTHDLQIRLAYESLAIFMDEIIKRMRYCFTDNDAADLTEVRRLIVSEIGPQEELQIIETRLHQKFICSPDLWNVDMERA
jgi:hypothetical protein